MRSESVLVQDFESPISASLPFHKQSGRSMRLSSTVIPTVWWSPSTHYEHDDQQEGENEDDESGAQ